MLPLKSKKTGAIKTTDANNLNAIIKTQREKNKTKNTELKAPPKERKNDYVLV